jgi:hypothetical protein
LDTASLWLFAPRHGSWSRCQPAAKCASSRLPHRVATYINCIGGKPRGGARSSQADGIDDYHELATGHDAMVTAPEDVARILRRVAQAIAGDA